MFKDVNWSDRRVDAAIQIVNGLIAKGLDPNLAVKKSVQLAGNLISLLVEQQHEEDERCAKRVDARIAKFVAEL